jgi:hypothetical protein
MPIESVAQYLNVSVAIVLVLRLTLSRLFQSHRVFGLFIAYDTFSSLFALVSSWGAWHLDYRYLWLTFAPLSWIFYVAVVFSILRGVMNEHRGILSLSQKVLFFCFAGAIAVSVISARLEYAAANVTDPDPIAFWVKLSFILERALCTTALLLLVLSLIYLLYFPVNVTRNVVSICAGLSVYFAVKITLLVTHNVWSPGSLRLVSLAVSFLSTACLLYWLFSLTPKGELKTVRPGHSWKPEQQQRLIEQLNALNDSLLKSTRAPRMSSMS